MNFPIPEDPRLQKLVDLLTREPGTKDSLSVLGKKVGASPKTLSRLLESELDVTFTDLRSSLRILHACKGLESGLPITEVAYSLGFSSQAAFSTLFKRLVGLTPKQYSSAK